jgi:phosphatidylglycerol:prolipoprotein diacylglycerol transferase
VLPVLDAFAPAVAAGHALGRVGCFFNGCCYGLPSNAWCAVQFPGHPLPVWPTQLFEALGLGLLCVLLMWRQRAGAIRRPGEVLATYLIGYGLLRFILECFRGDQPRVALGLSLAQFLSMGVVLAGAWILLRSRAASADARV